MSRLPPGEKKASAIPCPTWRFVWRTSTLHIWQRLHHDANRRSQDCASIGQPAMDHAYKYTRDRRSCVPLTSPPSPPLRQLRRRHCRAPTRLHRSRLPRCPRRARLVTLLSLSLSLSQSCLRNPSSDPNSPTSRSPCPMHAAQDAAPPSRSVRICPALGTISAVLSVCSRRRSTRRVRWPPPFLCT